MFFTVSATWYFIIMYESPEVYRLLIAEIIWFAAALIQLAYGKRMAEVKLLDYVRVVDKGSDIQLPIQIENKGVFPILFLTSMVRVSVLERDKERKINTWKSRNLAVWKQSCSLKGQEKRCEVISVKANKSGLCQFQLERVICYDVLHLFSSQKKSQQTISVLILPRIYPVAMEIQSTFRYFGEESGLYYEDGEGQDPAEILDIRPYQAGDRFQKIHWKLSQRTGNLMVREYSDPIGFAVVFLLDTGRFSEAYLETFMSISLQMCEEKCLHYLCFCEENGSLVRKAIVHIEDSYLFLQQIMSPQTGIRKSRRFQEDFYDDWYGRESYHTSLRLTETLDLYKQRESAGHIEVQDVPGSLAHLMLEL